MGKKVKENKENLVKVTMPNGEEKFLTAEEFTALMANSRRGGHSGNDVQVIAAIKDLYGTTLEGVVYNGITMNAEITHFQLDKRTAAFLVGFEVMGIKFKRDVSALVELDEVFAEANKIKLQIRKYMQEEKKTFDEAIVDLEIK